MFSSNRENFEHPTPNIERRTLKIRLRLRSVASTYLLFSGVSEAMDIPLQLRQNLPVKLPTNATIAPEKLTAYLLVRQARGDKSAFLAKAGYTAANPEQLLHDLRSQVLSKEAILIGRTKFGELYEIPSATHRPNRECASNLFDLDEGALVWCNEVHYLGAGQKEITWHLNFIPTSR